MSVSLFFSFGPKFVWSRERRYLRVSGNHVRRQLNNLNLPYLSTSSTDFYWSVNYVWSRSAVARAELELVQPKYLNNISNRNLVWKCMWCMNTNGNKLYKRNGASSSGWRSAVKLSKCIPLNVSVVIHLLNYFRRKSTVRRLITPYTLHLDIDTEVLHHPTRRQNWFLFVCRKHSSPYCCWSLWWISADGTFSPTRNLITMRCSTLRGTFCSLIALATHRQDWTGSNPSRREGGGCGFTLSRSHSCCAVRLVYTQISPGHIWTTLYFSYYFLTKIIFLIVCINFGPNKVGLQF